MKTRKVQKSDQSGLDVSLDDFINDEEFLIDGYEGYYAVTSEPEGEAAYVAIGWAIDDDPQELQLKIDGRADGLEVLNVLSPIMTSTALRALGFRPILGAVSAFSGR